MSTIETAIPGIWAKVEKGDTSEILSWLRENIHRHGRIFTAEELCTQVTGKPLSFSYFMEYARKKYQPLYGL
jgi:carboxypeptidase Taq